MSRLSRLRRFVHEHALAGVALTEAHHVAAVFGGAQLYNGTRPEPPGRAALVITTDAVFVLGNRTEVTRLCEEELAECMPGLVPIPVACSFHAWQFPASVEDWAGGREGPLAADSFGPHVTLVREFLERISYPLEPSELEQLGALGRRVASLLTDTAASLRPGVSECEVQAGLYQALLAVGINPDLIFVSFDERIAQFRHCRPGTTPLRSRAFLSVTASRRGLFVSATRLATLHADDELDREQRAANQIEADALDLVRRKLCDDAEATELSLAELHAEILTSYEKCGDGAAAEHHHLGGSAGFRGRVAKLAPGTSAVLRVGQPFAFNPVFGAGKSEDTWVVDPTTRELRCLTFDARWPETHITVGERTLPRPGVGRAGDAVVQVSGATSREIGIMGLGRIGGGAAQRLVAAGVRVVGYDPGLEHAIAGVEMVDSPEALVARLAPPRAVVLWVPADAVEATLWGEGQGLAHLCQPGDHIVEAGNTHYEDALRRAEALAAQGLHFVDAATSGGISGAERGYCIVTGCSPAEYERVAPLLKIVAAAGACARVGPVGAASFIKSVHNGIEYGMLAAMAEGLALLERAPETLELAPRAMAAFRQGTIIESRILDWFCEAADGSYGDLEPYVGGGETGRWCLQAALEAGVSMPVLSAALAARFASQGGDRTAARLLAEVRRLFGGHAVRGPEPSGHGPQSA